MGVIENICYHFCNIFFWAYRCDKKRTRDFLTKLWHVPTTSPVSLCSPFGTFYNKKHTRLQPASRWRAALEIHEILNCGCERIEFSVVMEMLKNLTNRSTTDSTTRKPIGQPRWNAMTVQKLQSRHWRIFQNRSNLYPKVVSATAKLMQKHLNFGYFLH